MTGPVASFYIFLTMYTGLDLMIWDLGNELKQDEDAPLEDVELFSYLHSVPCKYGHDEAVDRSWIVYQQQRAL